MSDSPAEDAAPAAAPEAMPQILLELAAILENATVGIVFTRNRRVVRSNPLAAQMFGYGAAEIVGVAGVDFYAGTADYEKAGAAAGPALAAGLAYRAESRMRRKDGSLFWCRVSAKAVDAQRPQNGTIWIFADIDAERSVREALASASRELETVFDTAVLGICVVRDDRLVRVNRRCEQLFGYAAGAMLGAAVGDWYPTEAEFAAAAASAYADFYAGNAHRREQLLRRRDGSTFWGRLSGRAFEQARRDGGAVWLIEDITAPRRAEEQVRQALREQEMIFDNAAVGIVYVCDRIVQRCNRKLEELFGYDEGELGGRSTRVFYADDGEFADSGLRAYADLEHSGAHVGEFRARRRDGSPLWVRAAGRTVAGRGDAAGSVWIFEDISERRQAQEALLRARGEREMRDGEGGVELADADALLQGEIFERMQVEQRIWHLAHHDGLTGLPKRALLLDRLEQALVQADRKVHKVAVIFLDIDRFKSINDTLGHAVGDELLKQVAERLRGAVRAADTVTRLGGDEFIVMLGEIQFAEDALSVAEKIVAALKPSVTAAGHELRVTLSLGIALYPDDGRDIYTLLQNADTAMYHAKAAGRNSFQFFGAEMNARASDRFDLEQRLRAAVHGGRLQLHYQPLIDIRRGEVTGFEALLRWDDPQRGVVPPGEFMPLAEDSGLILPIGEWALRQALRQNSQWQSEGWPALPVAVNLSPRQFRQQGLVDMVRRLLDETGQPARLLEIEITEATLLHDAAEALGKLRELDAMGVRLALDGFGSGYSSLAQLKRFPLRKLKGDRSFIDEISRDGGDVEIVAAIIDLARRLGLDAIAEGVESEDQVDRLMGLGCNAFQGYYWSHPLPPERVDELFHPPLLARRPSAED